MKTCGHSSDVGVFVLLAALGAALMLPTGAQAVKPTPPLKMTAGFDTTEPALNTIQTLRVSLTTSKSYENLAVAITLPPEISLVSGSPTWRGALAAGERRELAIQVVLRQAGRYAITVDAAFDPAESMFQSSRIHLNIIADAKTVSASMEPFVLMDLKRARTQAEMDAVLGIQGETEPDSTAPAGAGAVDAWPELEAPQPGKAPEEAPQSKAAPALTRTVTVSGRLTYKDTAGTAHPIRYALVRVLNMNSATTYQIMGEGRTGADGRYSIRATGGDPDGPPDIKVRVYSQIANNMVCGVGPTATSTYFMDSAYFPNYSSPTLVVNASTPRPVRGSTTDSIIPRAFSVMDAILQAGVEAYAMRGNRFPPRVPVIFPIVDDASYYWSRTGYIYILRADSLDWDVLMHEYFHFLSNKGCSLFPADTIPGGDHDGGSCIALHGKDKGVRLGWSEGLATFFSIMWQIEPSQTMLACPALPNTRDRRYTDTEDSTISWDLETIGNGAIGGLSQGYASECSVMAALYDLCDAAEDRSSDGRSVDTFNTTPKTIWTLINRGPYRDVGAFYNGVYSAIGNNLATLLRYTPIFAMNNIGPELSTPNEGTVVSSVVSPEFKWAPNGDPSANYRHNRFALVVARNNFQTILGIKDMIRDTKYKFTDAEWKAITDRSDNTGLLQWAVAGYNNLWPRMPGAGGIGHFVSNVQNIRLRAYHIRLTWNNRGADVDLHLVPPRGATCYYGNRNPDWGIAGDPNDNPSLDRDCITTCTEENLTLNLVRDPGTYRVRVHYYSDHGRGASYATVAILRYGQVIWRGSRTMSRTGDWWDVLSFRVTANGTVAEETLGDVYHDPADWPAAQKLDADEFDADEIDGALE